MDLPTPRFSSLRKDSPIKVYIKDELITVPVFKARAVVIGSGAAGLNAAIHLAETGFTPDDIAIITDAWGGGTSYNAGSDKQTYYKLSLAGIGMDSPMAMAQDLFSGGSMHGDIALAEATGSIEEFFHLVRLGVRFPRTAYDLYPGYQTDNDSRQRATSAGPYTSREMVACLGREINALGIPVLDHHLAVKLLVGEKDGQKKMVGIVCLDFGSLPDLDASITSIRDIRLKIILTPVVVLATGGPANIYKNSVYPVNHRCSHGLGIEAGASLQNLAFMQYGIASVQFRWNLSGSFQQAIPSYWIESDDGEKIEIIHPHFLSIGDVAFQTFLKGYHWPFDAAKCDIAMPNHSSMIDVIVHDIVVNYEKKVYIDFRENPWDLTGDKFSLEDLPAEGRDFLEESGAMQGTPINRLETLNPFAAKVYMDHGIDLNREPLQVHVAVQHCNGGFAGDINWESIDVKGLYPVGEANGTHGQRRPGGSALNAGQVGGLRAARHAAIQETLPFNTSEIESIIAFEISNILECIVLDDCGNESSATIDAMKGSIEERMSNAAGIVRWPSTLQSACAEAKMLVDTIHKGVCTNTWKDLLEYFRIRDAALSHWVILSAMTKQLRSQPFINPCYLVSEDPRYSLDSLHDTDSSEMTMQDNRILVTVLQDGKIYHRWENVRSVPETNGPFESLLPRDG